MVQLPQVTLCCVDAKNHALALRALQRSRRNIEFGRTIFLTDAIPHGIDVPVGIEVIPIGTVTSHEAYSRFVLKDLHPHVHTSHVLLVQWDGYVVNADAWTDDFLACDYLGAPWPDSNGGYTVGNGGFSLRSRNLLAALQDPGFSLVSKSEDVTICGYHRPRLETEFGIRFGAPEVALRFSFELDAGPVLLGAKTFGFHGLFNFFAVETQAEIIEILAHLSDSNVRSVTAELLLKNLVKFELFPAALALGARILECEPDNESVAREVVRAREGFNRQSAQLGFVARLLGKFTRAH